MRSNASGVAGWVKNSFIDFPGTISTVLFFSGCNLRCPYCHNPHLIHGTDTPDIPLSTILEFLQKRKELIRGVVLSGGEPTLHETARYISAEVRALGCRVKLDTNGLLPEKITAIAPDYLALDIKTIPENYSRILGCTYGDVAQRLEKSITIAKEMQENAEIRITIAPGIIDTTIIEEIGLIIQGIKKVYVQPMQTKTELLDPAMEKTTPIPMEEIKTYRETLLRYVERCEIRGVFETS